jgi:hypothetical protein
MADGHLGSAGANLPERAGNPGAPDTIRRAKTTTAIVSQTASRLH